MGKTRDQLLEEVRARILEESQRAENPRLDRLSCEACWNGRLHTEEEWKNHPLAGTGVDPLVTTPGSECSAR